MLNVFCSLHYSLAFKMSEKQRYCICRSTDSKSFMMYERIVVTWLSLAVNTVVWLPLYSQSIVAALSTGSLVIVLSSAMTSNFIHYSLLSAAYHCAKIVFSDIEHCIMYYIERKNSLSIYIV